MYRYTYDLINFVPLLSQLLFLYRFYINQIQVNKYLNFFIEKLNYSAYVLACFLTLDSAHW